MNIVIYTENNLENYYFSSSCNVCYHLGHIIIEQIDRPDHLIIVGDDFIVKKLYENLLFGVEKDVLVALLSMLPDHDLFYRLKEGDFIE